MSPKQFEKAFDKMIAAHEENLNYWKEMTKEVNKAVEGLINHREQGEMFSNLDVDHLELHKTFPDIKAELLYKLHSISLQFETKLSEFLETFSTQKNTLVQLSSQCSTISSSIPLANMINPKPGKTCPAHQLELSHNLARLYTSTYLGLSTWLEGRHLDKGVWKISKELSKVTYYPSLG
eukprot:TRINITY_DN25146_c0_g1_i1.p1 TRINITY_DN25146_c0_g1~~TRINITY_DN25146_c0_g1_i1.p1  ORF type:complete len:179 (+),score=59.60 TRINITY_DN25146_c0_g1_i1:33-569(+)